MMEAPNIQIPLSEKTRKENVLFWYTYVTSLVKFDVFIMFKGDSPKSVNFQVGKKIFLVFHFFFP